MGPIPATVIQAHAFFEIGRFNPLIATTQDGDLCRRAAYGGEFANTPDVVACLFRGQTWTSFTNYQRAPEYVKYSLDRILSGPGVFRRLRASADSAYWDARIIRVYLSSIGWNVKQRRWITACGLLFSALAFFVLSGRFFSSEFWAGFNAHHAPDILQFVMEKYQNQKNQKGATQAAVTKNLQ